MQEKAYDKRVFGPRSLIAHAFALVSHWPDLRAVLRRREVSRAFAEKIMLAVTQVNGCRYCNYAHSRAALRAGVSEAELRQLLALELGAFPEHEAVALAFAQHYAETEGRPDPAALRRLRDYYGPAAGEILTYIRMITIGNLYGNTFDAFLARLSGRPAPGGSAASELGALACGVAPFVLLPALLYLALSRLARALGRWR